MTARELVVLLALAMLGCGGSGAGAPDGGTEDAVSAETGPAGLRSFDVVAMLTGSLKGVPATSKFTLVLDAAAHHIIAGGGGRADVVPVTTSDGRIFHTTKTFTVGTLASCGLGTGLQFDPGDLTIDGSSLRASLKGAAEISCGDCSFAQPFSATLVGTDDVTAPLVLGTSSPSSPFDPFAVFASEPLPETASARLVGDDGSAVDLEPMMDPKAPVGGLPVIVGFTKPDAVLQDGQGYLVDFGGLVDFAGHVGSGNLRLASFPKAPVIAEDGFESAVGPTLGGAAVITDGPLAPLTGTHSVYIGGPMAPRPTNVAPGMALSVRFGVQPGDAMLRFNFRVVASVDAPGFIGDVRVGSLGRSAGVATPVSAVDDGVETVWPGGTSVQLGSLQAMAVALPSDRTSDLVVVIEAQGTSCGPSRSSAGLLIDDLRAQ